jgi:hypothetical protein
MCGAYVIPSVCTALAERNDMLYGSRHTVWEPQPPVDWFLADVTNPVVKFKKDKVVNLVSLSVYRSALRGVILALVSASCQYGQPSLI